jgi:CRP-like cAMP-binding protein
MSAVHDAFLRKLRAHSFLADEDEAALRSLRVLTRALAPEDDIVRQGDSPQFAVVVVDGLAARYHTMPDGNRQYLSFHYPGDMPDLQALFLRVMDHSVCAIGCAEIGLLPHKDLLTLFALRPPLAHTIWRESLIDAAILRAAITNNCSRLGHVRLAHFFCEQYCRARVAGLVDAGGCALPLSQTQLGQTLGLSFVTANRALQKLRRTGTVEFRNGRLEVHDWDRLREIAQFDPSYLHLDLLGVD